MTATCLCGGIRIALDGPVGPVGYCHCAQCQKASGSAFGANADVRRQEWTWVSGDDLLTEYESSPGTFRAFCRRCGSPVYKRRAADPDTRRIRLGLLDDDPGRRALCRSSTIATSTEGPTVRRRCWHSAGRAWSSVARCSTASCPDPGRATTRGWRPRSRRARLPGCSGRHPPGSRCGATGTCARAGRVPSA